MNDLFQTTPGPTEDPRLLITRLLLAALLGAAVAAIRTVAQPRTKPDAGFRTTLVLLTILTALVMSVVGNNGARAFALAGVLAVVRFRTIVDDTRDSAFVIFAMAEGLAIGYDYLQTAAIAVPVVAVVAILARVIGRNGPLAAPGADAILEVRVKFNSGAEKQVPGLVSKYGTHLRVTAVGTTTKDGEGLELRYHFRPKTADPAALVLAIKAVDGVDKVEFTLPK